jgi:hypothetical protein
MQDRITCKLVCHNVLGPRKSLPNPCLIVHCAWCSVLLLPACHRLLTLPLCLPA